MEAAYRRGTARDAWRGCRSCSRPIFRFLGALLLTPNLWSMDLNTVAGTGTGKSLKRGVYIFDLIGRQGPRGGSYLQLQLKRPEVEVVAVVSRLFEPRGGPRLVELVEPLGQYSVATLFPLPAPPHALLKL